MEHPSRESLAAFVMGVPPRDLESLRRHLEVCPECALLLEREARLESLLHEAARSASPRARTARPGFFDFRRPLLRVAAILVLMAAVTWAIASRRADRREIPPRSIAAEPGPGEPGWVAPMELAPGYLIASPADACRDPSHTDPYQPPS